MGASALNIIYTLSTDFTRPVIAAIVLALPISYVLTQTWLDSFAYRIDLQLWCFIVAGLLAFLFSLATVFFQALKAARTSPIQYIKAD